MMRLGNSASTWKNFSVNGLMWPDFKSPKFEIIFSFTYSSIIVASLETKQVV